MKRCLASSLLVIVMALSNLLVPLPSGAHRDRGPGDPCRREVGESILHITFYQTHVDPVTEFCEEIPRPGSAFLVVDVTPDLWDRPLSVEVLSSDATGAEQQVLFLPYRVYERGVANVDVSLDVGVSYQVRVGLDTRNAAEPVEFSFPFEVAAWYQAVLIPVVIVFLIVGGITVSIIRYRLNASA